VTGPAAEPLLAAKCATGAVVEPQPSASPAAKVTLLACRLGGGGALAGLHVLASTL
jgi:hypothetical protein